MLYAQNVRFKGRRKKKKIQTENDAAGQVTQQVLDFLLQMWEVLY